MPLRSAFTALVALASIAAAGSARAAIQSKSDRFAGTTVE